MGYLGLSGEAPKEDNLFKRLFWPSDNPFEVDHLGQQGFWICIVVALISTVALAMQGQWIIALVTLIFFGIGGIGVRERSTVAAALVAYAYLINQVATLFIGRFPGFISLVITVLLFANIRGTWIAAQWHKRGNPDEIPERMNETWKDWFVDQMPARVWPYTRIAFYAIAVVYTLLLWLGVGVTIYRLRHPVPASTPTPQPFYLPNNSWEK